MQGVEVEYMTAPISNLRSSRDMDTDWIRRHVAELTAQQERNEAEPWTLTDAPETYIEMMLRGIVGFRLAITRLEGKWKMSQNRDMKDREGVVRGLRRRGAGDDHEIADMVLRHAKPGS